MKITSRDIQLYLFKVIYIYIYIYFSYITKNTVLKIPKGDYF